MKFGETFKPQIEKLKKYTKMGAFLVALGLAPESRGQTVDKVDLGDGTELSGDASTLRFVEDFTEKAREGIKTLHLLDDKARELAHTYTKDSAEYVDACREIVAYVGQAQQFFEATKSREQSEALLQQFTLEKTESEMKDFFAMYEKTQHRENTTAEELAKLFKTYIFHTGSIEDIERAYRILATVGDEGKTTAEKIEKKVQKGRGGPQSDVESEALSAPEWLPPETLDKLVTMYFSMLLAKEKSDDIDLERDTLESSLNWLKAVFRDAGLELVEKDTRIAEKQ